MCVQIRPLSLCQTSGCRGVRCTRKRRPTKWPTQSIAHDKTQIPSKSERKWVRVVNMAGSHLAAVSGDPPPPAPHIFTSHATVQRLKVRKVAHPCVLPQWSHVMFFVWALGCSARCTHFIDQGQKCERSPHTKCESKERRSNSFCALEEPKITITWTAERTQWPWRVTGSVRSGNIILFFLQSVRVRAQSKRTKPKTTHRAHGDQDALQGARHLFARSSSRLSAVTSILAENCLRRRPKGALALLTWDERSWGRSWGLLGTA